MKNTKWGLSLLALGLTGNAFASDLESRVEELEFAAYENILKVGAEVSNRLDLVTREFADGKGDDLKEENIELWRSRFSLNLSANVSDKLSFYGKMSVRRVWNSVSSIGLGADDVIPLQGTYTEQDENIKLEKAFLNYKITDKLTFSLGKLPTVEGGPYHMTLGQPTRGQYPRVAYSNALDGMSLSYNMGDISVKYIAHPFRTYSTDSRGLVYQGIVNVAGDGHVEGGLGHVVVVDYDSNKHSFAKRVAATLTHVQIDDITVVEEKSGDWNSSSSAIGAGAYISGGATYDYKLNYALSVKNTSLYAEFQNVVNSPVSVAVAYAASESSAEFATSTTVTAKDATNPVDVGTAAGISAGASFEDEVEPAEASAYSLTVKYDLPTSNKSSVGFHYLNGDKNWGANDSSGTEPFDVTGPKGTVTQAFYNHPLDSGLVWTVGYIGKEITHSGADVEVDDSSTSTDLLKESSIYTEINLNI